MPGLTPAFEHCFPFPIWRLVFGPSGPAGGQVTAELRNGTDPALFLSTLDLPEGRPVAEVKAELPFHASLQAVRNGLGLYHRFDNSRLPVPTAIGALDLRTGKPLWEWPGHILVGADAETVRARRTSVTDTGLMPVVGFRLSDGSPVEAPVNFPENDNSGLRFPVSYTESNVYRPVIDRFVKKLTEHSPFGIIDYLEVADKIIISYYFHENNHQLRSYLLITDRQQTIWLHQRTAPFTDPARTTSGTQNPPSESSGNFCIWHDQIIFQQSQSCIRSYYLKHTP
ncbi:hypothetical protein [Larkinella soli]|uniref:hypothetical protein n=1 Tax=Larkinella soli TaxID=1770527 RepID=UPI000FFCB9D9|nr:hypothetical protein [Larkinella soli]